ncbi:cell adhesion molecule L1-like a isoform X2 [Denticeps clupeoides]|uniref:cell adhesion molecule L1-like a isoform X2 n=1 Tax=Denticeps clupeoides TaxID=299321 RepID=UPI0010A3F306|nr:neural cell adhesion molecule L1-like protein isoform X2 [Denticeps clupeoides]
MRLRWGCSLWLLLALSTPTFCFQIPTEVEQQPTITVRSPGSLIALPFDEGFALKCEAKGNPPPVYRWTKDGRDFDPRRDPRLFSEQNTGNFVIPNNRYTTQYQGKYRCYASNKLGTAITEETEFIVPNVPKFPKEVIPPVEVEVGQSTVLECNPPKGIPPLNIYWMTINLQHIEQDERVSMGLNGNLYFSNTLAKDSRGDYCCFAAFPTIRTIVQKNAMAVVVRPVVSYTNESEDNESTAPPIPERHPSLLLPSGDQSEKHIIKGDDLELECIAQGFPTPVIEWTKLGELLPERAALKNFGKLLTLAKIEEEDKGLYACRAKSSAGEASHFFKVSVEEPPQWAFEPPRSQLATIGSDVHIKCSAKGNPTPTITWMMNGELIGDSPTANRKVFGDTIMLHNVQPNDSATYQCEASNPHGTILANANLLVINLAPMVLTNNYLEYSVVQGRDATMNCEVFSSPPATIKWTAVDASKNTNSRRFSVSDNGSLLFRNVVKEDGGQYSCLASNSEGEAAIVARLDVKDPTVIVKHPEDLKIMRGAVAQFTCHAFYDPSLRSEFEIQWEKEGEDYLLRSTEDSGYYIDDGILRILNVSHSDEGTYTCIGRTNLDQDQSKAYLTVLDVPDAPENVVLSEPRNRSVKLTWLAADDHHSPITEFIIEYEEDNWEPGRWKELQRVPGNHDAVLLSLHGHINYRFRVSAANDMGTGPPSTLTERCKTPSTAPDRNPDKIKIEGHLPNQMDISWEPLLPIEHNGPGLEYKVSYRRLDVQDVWSEQMVKRHSFVVKNTPVFVPYEVKIQSRNQRGWAPDPKVVTGYSGEDFPMSSPDDVTVEVMNATALRVSWKPVPTSELRGHLGGYSVQWWRTSSLLTAKKIAEDKQSVRVPGNHSRTMIPGLKPFSEYRLSVSVFNTRGSGPNSPQVTFRTPQGVPEKIPILKPTNAQRNSITLVWAPPLESNGVLIGYSLQYQLVNDSLDLDKLQTVNISSPDITQWVLDDLEASSRYKFFLSACTEVGCGPHISEEGTLPAEHLFTTPVVASTETFDLSSFIEDLTTATEPGSTEMRQPYSSTAIAFPVNTSLPTLALSNVRYSINDTFAKISWTVEEKRRDSELYIAYMNHRDGKWKMSEAINASQTFHVIEGLRPGSVYTIRLQVSHWLDNSYIVEEVIQTSGQDSYLRNAGASSKGWFIGVLCAVAVLTLLALIACFVIRNKGGKYSVKEKEERQPDVESKGTNEDACEYSDSDEKPLKGSIHSLDCSDNKEDESGDSLVEYGDGDDEFNEDGSFIGEYSGHRHRGSAEMSGPTSSVA